MCGGLTGLDWVEVDLPRACAVTATPTEPSCQGQGGHSDHPAPSSSLPENRQDLYGFIDDLSMIYLSDLLARIFDCQIAGIAWWFVAPLVVLTLLSARHVFHTVAQKRFCLMYFWLFQLLTLSVGPQSRCLRAL